MKLPRRLLLFCLVLALSVRAEEAASAKSETPVAKEELVWPEIKDPQALIDFVKDEIAKMNTDGRRWNEYDGTGRGECFSSHIRFWIEVDPDRVWIDFDTHPYTGQGLFILTDPNVLPAKALSEHVGLFDTSNPKIKRVLRPLASLESDAMILLGSASVRWQNIQNLDKEKHSTPVVLQMWMPQYPIDLIRQGISGEATVRFTVSERGLATDIEIHAKYIELEAPIRQAMQQWRFESGVDLGSRLAAATRMALIVKFEIKED